MDVAPFVLELDGGSIMRGLPALGPTLGVDPTARFSSRPSLLYSLRSYEFATGSLESAVVGFAEFIEFEDMGDRVLAGTCVMVEL